jgi:dTMP kinase
VPGRGRLIALEGGEGSGKSTQAALLAQALGAQLTHEPGGTGLGQRIRSLVLDPRSSGLDPRAEALLMAADRAQHVSEVIGPALAAGRWVVTDRFEGSSLAYQGHGRGLELGELARVLAWARGPVAADLNVLLDLDAEVATSRRCGGPDRLEAEDPDFHARVLAGYRHLARSDPAAWAVVDASGPPEEVAARVLEAVRARLGRP